MLWRRRKLIARRALAGANRFVAGDSEWADALFEDRRRRRDELRKEASFAKRARE
jgi:hypothetical protein